MSSSISILEAFAVVFPLVIVSVAFYRGVVYEFMQIMAWIAGIAMAEALFPSTRPLVESTFPNSMFGDFAAITLVALPAALIVSLFSRAITREVNASRLGLVNKGLGAAFGLLRGAVIVWLVAGVMTWSFYRSVAQAYDKIDRGAASAKLEMTGGGMPITDIMCGRADPPDPALVRRLKSSEASMSPIIREIWRFSRTPEEFRILNVMRTVSVSICAK